MNTKLIITRHWRTNYNEKHLFDYKNNAKLNEIWKKQSKELAEILKKEKINIAYSSPLQRCIDTITPTSKEHNLEINIIQDFIEINSPKLQDKEFSCKNYKWNNSFGWWEKIYEAYERVTNALKKIILENPWKTILICSHWDPTFLMKMYLEKLKWNEISYDENKYTSWFFLENNPEKWWVNSMYTIEEIDSDLIK